MKRKFLFYIIFLIGVEYSVIVAAMLSGLLGSSVIAIGLSVIVPVGCFWGANTYAKKTFQYSNLGRIVTQYLLGVIELAAALLMNPLISLLRNCYIVLYPTPVFILEYFSLIGFSILVMVISLIRMWICIFKMWRRKDYDIE